PKDRRGDASMNQDLPPRASSLFREGIAETLSLLAAQGDALKKSGGLAQNVATEVVEELKNTLEWKRWATLSRVLPLLGEAAPDVFLTSVERSLNSHENPIQKLFGRTYHTGLLWALEVLAWHKDYLSRVALSLARMVPLPLPRNIANNP